MNAATATPAARAAATTTTTTPSSLPSPPRGTDSTVVVDTNNSDNRTTATAVMMNNKKPTAAGAGLGSGFEGGYDFIRGVNIGGWLVLERYIAPYMFAVTDCHMRVDSLCWYPGQLSAPSVDSHRHKFCDYSRCTPQRETTSMLTYDFPIDEYMLGDWFTKHDAREAGEAWLNTHFDRFVTFEDLRELRRVGITHVRVPLPHYVLGDRLETEPWIVGDRWRYFVRLCGWARSLGIQVWPDLHTAPGSQNGFDNSGQSLLQTTCLGWCQSPGNVRRTLRALQQIARRIADDGLADVVTGFGLLNEPFKDCDRNVYRQYLNDGLRVVRGILGDDFAVYASDMFSAPAFNDGQWPWLHATAPPAPNAAAASAAGAAAAAQVQPAAAAAGTPPSGIAGGAVTANGDPVVVGASPSVPSRTDAAAAAAAISTTSSAAAAATPSSLRSQSEQSQSQQTPAAAAFPYHNTYLDSHFYQVFDRNRRKLSPRQHIAFVCENEYREYTSCCYRDSPGPNAIPSGRAVAGSGGGRAGVKRMAGEFSGAVDTLVGSRLNDVMDGIVANNGTAPYIDANLTIAKQQFLKNFVKAQMVAYEAADVPGLSGAWFWWTLKMEGGAFAEWDFLRGVREGWIPPRLPPPNVTSQSLYGRCTDLIFRTDDSPHALREYPNPRTTPNLWNGPAIDDDVVLSHGESLHYPPGHGPINLIHYGRAATILHWVLFTSTVCFSLLLVRFFYKYRCVGCSKAKKRAQYTPIEAQLSI